MKRFTKLPAQQLFLGVLLLLLSTFLYSFSTVPTAPLHADTPPVEKKSRQETRRQQRLNKRYNRLYQRFDQSTHTKQRLRLQEKIRQVERQQEENPKATMGILGLCLSVLAVFTLSISTLYGFLGWIILAALIAVPALILSILHLSAMRKHPDRYILRGPAIAGIIISGLILMIALLYFMTISVI
jgi:hypothetical protein